VERRAAASDESSPRSWCFIEMAGRHSEDGPCRRSKHAGVRHVRTSARQRDGRFKSVGSTQERPDVAGIGNMPQCERDVAVEAVRDGVAPVDANDARRVCKRRNPSDELWSDVLARAQQVDGLAPCFVRGANEILALTYE
jgi:hypothetical protein